MNKQAVLKKALIKQGVVTAVILVIVGSVYFFTSSMLDASVPEKNNAESAFQKDQSDISTLKTQLDKSGIAESRFLEIRAERENLDFSSNKEALKEFLRDAQNRYRLSSSFKLNLTPEKLIENNNGGQSNYETYEHPGMRIEFSALSDAHVFSFLDDLKRNAPGIIKIETINLSRLGDIDKTTIDQIATGATPHTINAIIGFNWIGIKEKEKKPEPKSEAKP